MLFCHARLAAALSVSVSDLLLWITLTGATPVTALTGASPVDGVPGVTLEFIRRWELLRSTGLSAQDLDYLLRNGSAANTALAFTTAQSTALLTVLQTALLEAHRAAAHGSGHRRNIAGGRIRELRRNTVSNISANASSL